MTFSTENGFSWNVHKFPLWGSFLPHCFITCSSAVINVFVSGIKPAWRYTHSFFEHSFFWKVAQSIFCACASILHLGSELAGKLWQAADWRWMSLSSRTCRMNDSLFWAPHLSVLIRSLSYSSLWFPIFTFYLSFVPQASFYSPFLFLSLSVCLPCFKLSSFKLSSVQTVFCFRRFTPVCSHIFIGKN